MDQTELVQFVTDAFDRRGIVYAINGSHASFAYGEHRFTNDIDLIARMNVQQLQGLLSEFPSDQFYVSAIAAQQAVTQGGQFNIIHPTTGLKIDVIIPSNPAWPDQFARRLLLATPGDRDAWFVSPEDLILNKMDFFRQGESERHLRDIAAMLKISRERIDRGYIGEWAKKLGLDEIWQKICQRVP